MELNKLLTAALAAAGIAVSAGKANAAVLSVKADYAPSAVCERTTADISPLMTVDSTDELQEDELTLGARFWKKGIIRNSALIIEDAMIMQNGSLTRDSTVFDIIKISEYGKHTRLRNTLKAIAMFKGFGAGLDYLAENETRNYTQHAIIDNKITTEQRLQMFGPMIRLFLSHQGNINIGFNTDVSYFSKGNETYTLAFEDKSLPGDSEFERKRELSSILSETSIVLGKPFKNKTLNEIGAKAWADYYTKDVKQKETTEEYMPVYEEYKDTRLRYGAEIFAKLKKYLTLRLGVKKEQHSSKGTIETKNDDQTRFYGGVQADIFF